MTFPLAGQRDKDWRITKGFSSTHPGIDIAPIPAGKTGVACRAPESGVVSLEGSKPQLEGNYVILKGDSGRYYYFGHFASTNVRTGYRVNEGQVIGILGKSGLATGVHVHFEVRPAFSSGNQLDPNRINWQEGGNNMDEIEKIYKQLDQINKTAAKDQKAVSDLYGIVDQLQKNLAALKKSVDNLSPIVGKKFTLTQVEE